MADQPAKDKNMTINISLRRGLLDKIDQFADLEFATRSEFVRQAVTEKIDELEAREAALEHLTPETAEQIIRQSPQPARYQLKARDITGDPTKNDEYATTEAADQKTDMAWRRRRQWQDMQRPAAGHPRRRRFDVQ